jgi:hypothetical protein
MGKLLVVFEELPTFSVSQWVAVASKIKRAVTGKVETYSDKYMRGFEAQNLNNYIINTNVDALMTSEGRRIFHIDVNTIHERDYAYFGELSRLVQNNEVGEALFAYFISIDTSNFGGQKDMPETRGQRNAVVARLDSVHEFLKQKYILKRKAIVKKDVGELFEEYTTFMIGKDKKPHSKFDFTAKMREIQCDYYKSNGKNKYDVSYDKLKTIADKKKWIHELDEFKDEDDDFKVEEDQFGVEAVKKYDEEQKALKEKTVKVFMPIKTKYEVIKTPWINDLECEIKKSKEINKEIKELEKKGAEFIANYEINKMMMDTPVAKIGYEKLVHEEDINSDEEVEFDYEDMDLDEALRAYFK